MHAHRAAVVAADELAHLSGALTRELPRHVAAAGYAIVSEALVNAHRHAQATEVLVHLSDGATLAIDVTDNGRGIADGHAPGVGLRSMRERSAELGGTCTIRHGDHGGTVVEVRLPLGTGR